MDNNKPLLIVNDLHVSIDDKDILKGINLQVNLGEVHAIMGPNGSGKSTLANVISGRPGYSITSGSIEYLGENINEELPEIRARKGIFLAFQYPVELPGVRSWQFLKSSVDAIRKEKGESELGVKEFDSLLETHRNKVEMNPDLVKRSVNEGFSGGEKKRNEIMQLSLLNPTLALLDETDSGLDIDALRIVSNGVNDFKSENNSVLIVTHYQRILEYIKPDFVHVLVDGNIVKSGDSNLALELEEKGYEVRIGKFPCSGAGKAKASGNDEGFIKVIFDKKYGEWLGCHMIGLGVTDMIAEAVLGRKLETTGEEVLKTIHPHPTMSEAVVEAVADAYGEVIHL